ncbi:hypothetical protein N0V82_006118 [Gnomoniopsis sp. IMI 355080]|nr:hypothetical protein N0V82_006118 [Gnomoniopsis sp. IMI 355080]
MDVDDAFDCILIGDNSAEMAERALAKSREAEDESGLRPEAFQPMCSLVKAVLHVRLMRCDAMTPHQRVEFLRLLPPISATRSQANGRKTPDQPIPRNSNNGRELAQIDKTKADISESETSLAEPTSPTVESKITSLWERLHSAFALIKIMLECEAQEVAAHCYTYDIRLTLATSQGEIIRRDGTGCILPIDVGQLYGSPSKPINVLKAKTANKGKLDATTDGIHVDIFTGLETKYGNVTTGIVFGPPSLNILYPPTQQIIGPYTDD